MAYLKNWTDNFFQIFLGTSWVAVSINNITTRASREMTSRKNIKIFDFNGVNVAKHWHVAGEVFAISDCLVRIVCIVALYKRPSISEGRLYNHNGTLSEYIMSSVLPAYSAETANRHSIRTLYLHRTKFCVGCQDLFLSVEHILSHWAE